MLLYEIRTPRLRLRQWRRDDLAPLARMHSDPMVMRYFPAPLSRPKSDALAQRCDNFMRQHGWGVWALEQLDTGQFIGFLGLNIPSSAHEFMPCVEIVWRLARAQWRQGYALEAARQCLQFGFDTLELDSIVGFTSIQNQASHGLMRRLNMRHERDFLHPDLPTDSALRAHCLYRITRREFI